MILSLSEQTHLFLISVYIGIIIVVFYDFFRALRKIYKFKNGKIYLQDIVFIFIITVYALYVYLYENNGDIRFYYFIGIFFGGVIYLLALSNKVIRVFCFFIGLVNKSISVVIKVVFIPYKMMQAFLKPYVKIFSGRFSRKLRQIKYYIFKPKKYLYQKKRRIKQMIKVLKEKV